MNGIKRKEREERSINKSSKAKILMTAAFFALIVAGALYFVMVRAEKKVLTNYERGTALMVVKKIPKGTELSEKNIGIYIKVTDAEKNFIPETAVTQLADLQGQIAEFTIDEGVLLTKSMFTPLEEVLRDMENPVIAGFRAEDMYQVAGGVLRAGDKIHILQVNPKEQTSVISWTNLYVQEVFDNNGNCIAGDDDISNVTRINIYMDKKDVERFYEGLSQGELRAVKVVEKERGEI